MPSFTFIVPATIIVTVDAPNAYDAESDIRELQAVSTDTPNASARCNLTEFSVDVERADIERTLIRIGDVDVSEMDEPHACDRCGTVYDEASGDGYAGLCPSCADKTEPAL